MFLVIIEAHTIASGVRFGRAVVKVRLRADKMRCWWKGVSLSLAPQGPTI